MAKTVLNGRAIGLDFGTTNSVASVAADGAVQTAMYARPDGMETIFPTLLTFWQEEDARRTQTKVEGGQWAIDVFLDYAPDCRFVKSIKTFAANPHFTTANIYGGRYEFQAMMGAFLNAMRAHSGQDWGADKIVLGRPIRFAGQSADEELALQRYKAAIDGLGFAHMQTVYEPLAAAYYFVRELQGEATIFVGDLGGGTSDFSLLRVKRKGGQFSFEPLSSCGVGIAGDQFDYRIIQNTLAPLLGKGSQYRSFDKVLDVPSNYYANLASWHELSLLRGSSLYRELVSLRRDSLAPELIDRFIRFIDSERLHDLYVTVSAAKSALSEAEQAQFTLELEEETIEAEIKRSDFEIWIEDDLNKLDGLITQTLDDAGLAANDVDTVFLTGGTSFVPAVNKLFRHRFARADVESGDQLVSVANGLALIAQDEDTAQWLAG